MHSIEYPILSREEVRAIDAAAMEELKIPGLVLMENAARGVVEVVQSLDFERCVILCGRGNNGGDGLAVARLLAAIDQPADVFLLPGERPLTADAKSNFKILNRCGIEVRALESESNWTSLRSSTVVIDCLLGTGFQGTLRDALRKTTAAINASPADVVSVDVPSGLDCQTGQPSPDCVRANTTVTFVGRKVGFGCEQAHEVLGDVVVKPIGLPLDWVHSWLGQRRANS